MIAPTYGSFGGYGAPYGDFCSRKQKTYERLQQRSWKFRQKGRTKRMEKILSNARAAGCEWALTDEQKLALAPPDPSLYAVNVAQETAAAQAAIGFTPTSGGLSNTLLIVGALGLGAVLLAVYLGRSS